MPICWRLHEASPSYNEFRLHQKARHGGPCAKKHKPIAHLYASKAIHYRSAIHVHV